MTKSNRLLLLGAAAWLCAAPAFSAVVKAVPELAQPVNLGQVGSSLGSSLSPRDLFVSNFNKTGLPVFMSIRPDRLEALAARHPAAGMKVDPRIKEVIAESRDIEATRSMEIVDGRLRGNATQVRIEIREKGKNGIYVETYAKGDPRTEAGRAKIRMNVERAVQKFRDMVLTRSEAWIFDGDPRPRSVRRQQP